MHSDVAKNARLVNAEHEVQIHLLNDLRDALHQGRDVRELQARLVALSRSHFQSEELLMGLHAYPDQSSHAEDHRQMLASLEGMSHAAAVDELSLTLRRHIRERDSKLHAFLENVEAS